MPDTLSLKAVAVGDLEQELAKTRRMLERVPDEHLAWKPHEKSMSLGVLAVHLANLVWWQTVILQEEGFDVAVPQPPRGEPTCTADVLRTFDENAVGLRAALAAFDEGEMGTLWTLRSGDQVFFSKPRAAVLRSFGISHLVHHRGQLSVYLRLLDVPVPPSFGPTADEQGL